MTERSLRLILGDQLSLGISSLVDADVAADVVLMAEVMQEATYVRHHRKKIAFLFSAMRHFAAELGGAGLKVDYVAIDHPDNAGSLRAELVRAVHRHRPARLVVTEAGEHRLARDMAQWRAACGVPVEIREDTRFFCSHAIFDQWAKGRRQLRLEHFYRAQRVATGLLMTADGRPAGGRWNYDSENRRGLGRDVAVPPPFLVEPDALTHAVIALVDRRFPDHFGDLLPFGLAVTRMQAEAAFAHFRRVALPCFGDYQDAMKQDEPVLFHSLIAPYLNCGLLDPRAVCLMVEADYRAGRVPINAAEGFIRQILGWREFVRGVYWLHMPRYGERNHLDAYAPLPQFYWTGDTPMNCLKQCIVQTRRHAYAHHIQRLMVTGNFALLCGVAPREINEWYLIVYADAYDWVVSPNVLGMAVFADGGLFASKPYAAGGKYIKRMSDYCRHCQFDVDSTVGEDACPFNYLYWHFLMRNRDRLAGNARLKLIYSALDRFGPDRREAIRGQSERFLNSLN